MILATVSLSAALICMNGQCDKALVGKDTPRGTFALVQRKTLSPGYGGDVLKFLETKDSVYALHRVYLLNPKQQRMRRLTTGTTAERRDVTDGCINVLPEVYEKFKSATHITIRD